MVASKYRTRVLAMARSTSYLMQPPQVISQMKQAREGNLKAEIQALRTRYGYHLGYRQIHALLIKKGTSASLYLVRKVMELAGFFGLPKKRRYPKGNYSLEIANLIKGNFQSQTPHEKWFIDITQKRYLSGTIYLAVIKDAATRIVVGYASGRRPNSDLVVRALVMATSRYATTGTIIHSDMGSVFKSEHYRKAVKQAGLIQSMGNAGLSFANQAIESFFGKIKTELLHTRSWKTYDEINRAITYYCESFYNSIRPQMALGGRTPLEEFHRLTTCTSIQAAISVA
jgi:transposase InsO family protein